MYYYQYVLIFLHKGDSGSCANKAQSLGAQDGIQHNTFLRETFSFSPQSSSVSYNKVMVSNLIIIRINEVYLFIHDI